MDNIDNRNRSSKDNRSNSSEDYLLHASSAVEAGDKTLGIHLYLAAFERAKNENLVPSERSLEGMETAWNLAVKTGQRSLAEYIFEKLEPYWSADEMAHHADQLQKLALDKLEEFGLSREALEDMAEMVNQDILGLPSDVLCQIEEGDVLSNVSEAVSGMLERHQEADAESQPSSESSSEADEPESNPSAPQEAEASPAPRAIEFPQIVIPTKKKKRKSESESKNVNRFDYSSISGFDSVIVEMAKFGIGKDRDPEFRQFIKMLNMRHGLPQMPGVGTLVFRSPAREDANYFMVATVGEMKIPAVRMRFDQNVQGQPILCVMASADFKSRLSNLSRIGFTGPTALILEDLDLWSLPITEPSFDDPRDILQAQMTRGAREAVSLIRSAMENPEVTVFISASNPENISPFFLEGSPDYRLVDIDFPNEEERKALWRSAQAAHPSLRGLDVSQMVKFSASMSRFEIVAITSEAVEYAYRQSLSQERFVAVHTDDIVARLSNFQPLDSEQYQEMEDFVVKDFRKTIDELDSFDDLLKE